MACSWALPAHPPRPVDDSVAAVQCRQGDEGKWQRRIALFL